MERLVRRLLLGLLAVVLSLIVLHPPAQAHDLGLITVDARLDPGRRYELVISADVDHLSASGLGLDGLIATARQTQPPTPDAFEPVGAAFAQKLAASSSVWIDGQIVGFPMLVDVLVKMPGQPGMEGQSHPRLMVHFSGTAPLSAQKWGFQTDLAVGQYLIRVVRDADPEPLAHWAESGKPMTPVSFDVRQPTVPGREGDQIEPGVRRSPGAVFGEYVHLGFTHIVPGGLDHVLFVLGLFFAAVTMRTLLLQVTAFTVAHCVTLGLGVTGAVKVSPTIVEPLIAISIVVVALENVIPRRVHVRGDGTLSEWIGPRWVWRTALVFAFGLLHGLGFAGVLGEVGLPEGQLGVALLGFNVGVEVGQIAVVLGALATVGLLRARPWYRVWVVVPASVAIAGVGVVWAVDRL